MATLKVYDVKEMRDARMPRALCDLLGARSRGQSPYWVAAHSKDEALARLREVGSLHRAHHLRVAEVATTSHRYSLFTLLTHPGDVIGYVRTAENDPIALIPAGETEARIVARWQRDPESETNGLIPVLTTPENAYANPEPPTCNPLTDSCDNCGSTACPACRSDQWDEDGEKVCVSCVARAAEWDDED